MRGACEAAQQVEMDGDALRRRAGCRFSVELNLVRRKAAVEFYRRRRERLVEGKGDRARHREPERVVAVAPVFDEGDVCVCTSRCFPTRHVM